MAGVVASLFPNWEQAKERLKPAADAYLGFTKSMWRGMSQAPFSLVDLASLPFTMSGAVDPDNVVGGTRQAERNSLVLPKATEGNPTLNEMGEIGGGMLTPGIFGGMVGPAASVLGPAGKIASKTNDLIARDIGQRTGDRVAMARAARLARDPKFTNRIEQFRNNQDQQAEAVINGFSRSIGTVKGRGDLGKRLQDNFSKWYDDMAKRYKERNDANFNQALKSEEANTLPIPISHAGLERVGKFVAENMPKGGSENIKNALDNYMVEVSDVMTREMTPAGLAQLLREANEKFTVSTFKAGPYDSTGPAFADRMRTVYKQALKDRLEDTIKDGGPTADIALDLKRANHVFEVTTELQKKYKNQSLAKFLKAKDDEVLNPETVVDKFKKLSPTERQFFTAVSNKVAPEMIDDMRRHIFDDLVKGGYSARSGRDSLQAEFSIPGFMKKVDDLKTNNPEMYNWVIGSDPAIQSKFDDITEQARQAMTMRGGVDEAHSMVDTAQRIGSAAIGVASGKIGGARTADVSISAIRDFFTDKEALYNHIFNDGPPPPGVVGSMKNRLTPEAVDGGGSQTGLQVGAAAQGATLQVGPDAPMVQEPQESPSEALGADNFVVDESDLGWSQQTPVEAPMAPAEDFTIDEEDRGWSKR